MLLSFLVFIAVALLLFVLRKEINIYEDRIEILQNAIGRKKQYKFGNLENWEYAEFYSPKLGQVRNIILNLKEENHNKSDRIKFILSA